MNNRLWVNGHSLIQNVLDGGVTCEDCGKIWTRLELLSQQDPSNLFTGPCPAPPPKDKP